MTTFNLTAKRHDSRVLATWLAGRDGGAQRAAASIENAAVVSSDNEGMRELFGSIPSSSGYPVTDRTAMQVTTVYACLSKLSGALLQLPLHEYLTRTEGVAERAPVSPLWWLLNESPHPRWTAASWKEWIVYSVMLRGDQHTEIIRDKSRSGGGQIKGLKPHHPDCSRARIVDDRLVYDVIDPQTGEMYTVDQDDMLHFTGFGFDGVRSISAIQYVARNAIGNSLAAANFSGKTMGEGAMPQIALTYPNKLDSDQLKDLRDNFVSIYTGTGARKIPLIMTQGGEAKPLNISPVDMELLASRQFEREDICHALGVPPVLIGDNVKTSSWGTGIEQITLGFVLYSMKPHLIRWEEEQNRKFYRKAGRFLEYDLDGLLSGDSKAQNEGFRAALGGPGTGDGYMTVNEVRRKKNLTPVDDGNELFKAQRTTTPTGQKP